MPTSACQNGDEDEYGGDWDESELQEAAALAAAQTPSRTGALQQRTLYGTRVAAHVHKSPGTAIYTPRIQRKDRNEPPTHHDLDLEAIKTWVYPTNFSQRDYQFNMIQSALYTNLLIALPTGLGKTFIAAVVMYNWYRWAPRSKLFFLAPTKPLVGQQIDACYSICGIPARDMAEMTGSIDVAKREAAYRQRRVFFMTPQTFENDLRKGIIEPRDISCVVVDEAHHATGNYAYVNCVSLIREQHDSFRILALTATPGKTVEIVQEVVDSLHISRIEIRNDASIDIRQYVHGKDVDTVVLDLPPDMLQLQEQLSALMRPLLQKLLSIGVGMSGDPAKLSVFAVKSACDRWRNMTARNGPNLGIVYNTGAYLSTLAHGMTMLNEHGVRPFLTMMTELDEAGSAAGRSKLPPSVRGNDGWHNMLREMRRLTSDPGYYGHPKLDKLSAVLLNHFSQAEDAGEKGTRAMVFTSLRVSADAILAILKQHAPLIRPTPFFGQGKGSSGAKESGMTQKEQKATIAQFKQGKYNVIVATSVGEEGLDIGEIDLIICYDTSSSPARMLQRMGRTGRKRDGKVFILCCRGKEENAWIKAKDSHRVMSSKIEQGVDIKLSDDVKRIIPWTIKPECQKRLLEVPSDDKKSDRELTVTAAKRKRVTKRASAADIPKGAFQGFVSAGALKDEDIQRENPYKRRKRINYDDRICDLSASREEGLLTKDEQIELEYRYAIGQETGSAPSADRTESVFASVREARALTRTVNVPHSESTRSLIAMVRDGWIKGALAQRTDRWRQITDAVDGGVFDSSASSGALQNTKPSQVPIMRPPLVSTQHQQQHTSLTQPSPLENVRGRVSRGRSALDLIHGKADVTGTSSGRSSDSSVDLPTQVPAHGCQSTAKDEIEDDLLGDASQRTIDRFERQHAGRAKVDAALLEDDGSDDELPDPVLGVHRRPTPPTVTGMQHTTATHTRVSATARVRRRRIVDDDDDDDDYE
ncbi:3'-5' DNA helicase [Savitreella phatthalungensis]